MEHVREMDTRLSKFRKSQQSMFKIFYNMYCRATKLKTKKEKNIYIEIRPKFEGESLRW